MAHKTKHSDKSSERSAPGLLATRNDLPAEARSAMVALLNQQLADLTDLFTQTKQAHWNVKGAEFIALHKLYDDLAGEVLAYIDDVAERAVQLGGVAAGTLRMGADATRLEEFPAGAVGSTESVTLVADRFATVAASSRAAIDTATEAADADTADLFTEISRGLDKSLWFLEAHLPA